MIICLSVCVFSLCKKLTRQEDQKLFFSSLFGLITGGKGINDIMHILMSDQIYISVADHFG